MRTCDMYKDRFRSEQTLRQGYAEGRDIRTSLAWLCHWQYKKYLEGLIHKTLYEKDKT